MFNYDRFSGTPWDGMEHCYYCGLDYKLNKNWPHICVSDDDPIIQTWKLQRPEQRCCQCQKGIYQGDGRFKVFGDVYCLNCGEKHATTRWEALNDT